MNASDVRILLRQGASYGAVGGLALLVDWGTFVLASWLGMPAVPANLAARLAGAGVAFLLNGLVTFRDPDGGRLGWRRFVRYAITWALLTFVSTWAMATVTYHASLEAAWLAKPMVEAVLAAVSFVLYRYWIYK